MKQHKKKLSLGYISFRNIYKHVLYVVNRNVFKICLRNNVKFTFKSRKTDFFPIFKNGYQTNLVCSNFSFTPEKKGLFRLKQNMENSTELKISGTVQIQKFRKNLKLMYLAFKMFQINRLFLVIHKFCRKLESSMEYQRYQILFALNAKNKLVLSACLILLYRLAQKNGIDMKF